ncbi:MAG: hypothetical protein KAW45_07070 [Thermoplasmatales archaeon]|nr:hypothetical protein [Thermoplasmatales archaeon]
MLCFVINIYVKDFYFFFIFLYEKTNSNSHITPENTSAIKELQYLIVKNVPARINNPIVVRLAV